MRYTAMPRLMWAAFSGTFAKALKSEMNINDTKTVMKNALRDYRKIIGETDEFDKGSRFLVNILSCAMFTSVLMNLPTKPTIEQATSLYRKAMSENFFMQFAAKHSDSYTKKGREKLKSDALKSQSVTNPYDWRFAVEDGGTINQYTATFYTCGICYMMKKWGMKEYIPAMCALDYDMAHMNNTRFSREYTLASGGPYCDCHYDHTPYTP